MRGLRASSARTCWSCGSATSTAPAILLSWACEAAAPLFFRIVDAISANRKLVEPAYRQPPRLERVDVCSASGDLPNAECPQTVSTWYVPGVSPIRVSQVHRRVWIDTRTGEQACPPYDPTHTRSEVFEFWPTELLQLFAQAGMPRRRPPPAGDCQRDMAGGTPPKITSPVIAATYTIRAGRIGNETVPLAANADSEVRRLHWFVDESYVGHECAGHRAGVESAQLGALHRPYRGRSWTSGQPAVGCGAGAIRVG